VACGFSANVVSTVKKQSWVLPVEGDPASSRMVPELSWLERRESTLKEVFQCEIDSSITQHHQTEGKVGLVYMTG
jgi:hypothetical protein